MLVKEIDFDSIFNAYPHQREFMLKFFGGEKRFHMLLWHRRGGKDAVVLCCVWLIASMEPGNYVYTLPKIKQARNVVWEGKDLDGKRWIDGIPKHLIKSMNATECKIYLRNGSIIHITGADALMDSHLGSNLRLFVASEYHKTSPHVWDYVRPIIKRSGGRALFLYTAFGKGHAHKMFHNNKNLPLWNCSKLTVDDTRDERGRYIFSPEEIEDERLSGMDECLIQQEYYCDETAAIKGTYFADEIALAHKEGRIRRGIQVQHMLPVHTSWDIGSRDTNSIWFFQYEKGQFYYFHQYNKNYGSIEHYAAYLEKIRKDYGFRAYGHHFMPHDVAITEWGTGKSRRVQLMEGGINIHPVPRLRVIERVQCARAMFKDVHIDEDGCSTGLEALTVTRSKYNETGEVVGDEVHDWSSHPAAAFEYGLVGWLDCYNQPKLKVQKQYARRRA